MTRTLDYICRTFAQTIWEVDVRKDCLLAILWLKTIMQDPGKFYIWLIILYLQNFMLFRGFETRF